MCDSHVQPGDHLIQDVGDPDVKARRRTLHVPLHPGGVPADYTPFYFAPRSPMLFKISRGGVQHYSDGQDPLVYLVTDMQVVKDHGLAYVFSDGNCGSAFTEYFSEDSDLDKVDWDIMQEQWWRNTPEDGDRMRRRMAELLVHHKLPCDAVLGFAARNEERTKALREILDEVRWNKPVVVQPGWYY